MKKPTTISKESVSEYREFVQLRLRKRVLEAIEVVLEEEVDQALGCGSYERAEDRRGYRNGAETRRVTTSVGTRELRVPRARVRDEETGETTEFRSELLPRYARRTREVAEAILGTYLSGANSRRIRKALKPLLGEEHLSKSAVSRVVSRLKERFEEWQNRALSEEVYAIVYLDGFHLKVRMAKRVISVPVLVALGVAPDGQKRLLSLRLAVSEASTHWGSVLEGLQARGLRAPKLVISDGHKGLTKALEKWPRKSKKPVSGRGAGCSDVPSTSAPTCSNIARRTHAVSSGVTTTGSSTPRTGSMLAKPMTSSSPSGRLSRRPSSEA